MARRRGMAGAGPAPGPISRRGRRVWTVAFQLRLRGAQAREEAQATVRRVTGELAHAKLKRLANRQILTEAEPGLFTFTRKRT